MPDRKTTAPAFPLLGGDWLKGTARLSAAERGYYLDLLLFTWDSDEPVPDAETEQMQIARCTSRREWRAVWARLNAKWFKVEGGYRNRRCEEERAKLRGYRKAKADAGRAGAQSRWRNHDRPDGTAITDEMTDGMANGWPSISSSKDLDPKERDRDPAPTRELLKFFSDQHQQRFGEPADISGKKDGAILAAQFKQRGREKTEQLIAAFFRMNDPWVLQRGFSVGIFKTQLPKLLAAGGPPQPRRDWAEECKELHDGRCGNPVFHAAKMAEFLEPA